MTERLEGETHQVLNQVPGLNNYNPLDCDRSLQKSLSLTDSDWAVKRIRDYSLLAGSDLREAGRQANRHKPELHSHDQRGFRINEVEFHPAYHQLMAAAIASGWPTLPWQQARPGAHSVRAAMEYLHHQADPGTGCPLTMTFAALPTLRHNGPLAKEWIPKILRAEYDPRNIPWQEKKAVTIGMGMTEKQGGSDVRSNTSCARFTGKTELGPTYEITGHKWFMSAPMSDAFLVLAQTEVGLSCFLLPRWRPDNTLNGLYFQRLKDKLGNHSNASSEVEFRNAFAWMVGEEGRGVATIIEMVAFTRFDCMVGSAALMRHALVQAIHHSRHRQVMGKLLAVQPLMQGVLADLAITSEASLHLAMRTARALDNAESDPAEKLLLRLATPVGKYWNCKIAPGFIYEAMECLGGNGYVEDGILPLLYREAPVNAIWEGSGNVQCLDVLRAINKNRDCLDVMVNEIEAGLGVEQLYDQFCNSLKNELLRYLNDEHLARALVEKLALALQTSLMLRHGFPPSAERFCRTYLSESSHIMYGAGTYNHDVAAVLDYTFPP